MSVTESIVKKSGKHPLVAAKQTIWVFESDVNGQHKRGAPALAVHCHGAESGNPSGIMGDSYALTTRDDAGNLLPWEQIQQQVRTFRDYVQTQPERNFRVLPSSYKKSEQQHARFTDFLRNVLGNCELPGRMLDRLDRLDTVRIILLDTNVTLVETERRRVLDQYFAANVGLWDVDHIEIVSFGSAQSLVANDKFAKERGYRHRIITPDPDFYGSNTVVVNQFRTHR
jgi:hypothetical protein